MTSLWAHQREAVEFLEPKPAGMLAMEMGCVDGMAVVRVIRARQSFEITLAELHRKLTGGESGRGRKWNLAFPTTIRTLCGDRFRHTQIVRTIDSGARPVVKLTLADGKMLRLTADHEIAVPTEEGIEFGWCAAGDLQPGQQVLVNGQEVCRQCGSTKPVARGGQPENIGLCRSCCCRRRKPRPRTVRSVIDADGYVRLYNRHDHPRANPAGQVYEHIVVMESVLGRPIERDEHIHHVNGIGHDNRPENLKVMRGADHVRKHDPVLHVDGGISAKGGKIVLLPKSTEVVSVEPDGETHVYDLTVEGPWHNFVANGIVVHNCGKSLCALELLARWQAQRVLVLCPKSVVSVWPGEAEKHFPNTYRCTAPRKGTVARRTNEFEQQAALAAQTGEALLAVFNYEAAVREPLYARLTAEPWDVLVSDECVPAGTAIATPLGNRAIEELVEGDEVWGYDHEAKAVRATRITGTFRRQSNAPMNRVGDTVLTAEHPVWTADSGYREAGELNRMETVGYISDLSNPELRMWRLAIRREMNHGAREVFNLETGTSNYFANALLVHNCHRIKAPTGSTSKAVAALAAHIPRRLGLTGTPMPHSPLDIWAQYRALDPTIFGTSHTLFKSRYAVEKPGVVKTGEERWPQGKPPLIAAAEARLGKPLRDFVVSTVWSGYTVNDCADIAGLPWRVLWKALPNLGLRVFNRTEGCQNLDDLHERMYRIAYRCRAADVLDLPPFVDVTRTCELSAPARRAYQSMAEELCVQLDEGEVTAGNALAKLLRLQQIANGYLPVEGEPAVLDSAKANLLEDLLADLQPPGGEDPPEPVVVFCRFHHDLDVVLERAAKQGHVVGELSGRRNELAAWQAGDTNVLAVQEQAGGLGVDMSRARYAIFYSLNWSLGDYEQARARVHRPGQTRPVTYLHLVAEGTVDETIMEALETKGDVVRHVVDGLRKRRS